MREVIALHIGQAGIQIGSACWELFCLEHGINPNGTLPNANEALNNDDTFQTWFQETGAGKFVPRALNIDLEPTCVDEIRNGAYKELFHPENLIAGKEDAANVYARGYYLLGNEVIDLIMDRIRLTADQCTGLQGFIAFHSYGGGTGSGLTSKILERIAGDYPKKTNISFSIYPSKNIASSCVEPYNSVFATKGLLEFVNVSFLVDNQAMYDVVKRNLNVDNPRFTNLNRMIAQAVSSITASMRFKGDLNCDLTEFQTNLVALPRLKFPICSYAPFIAAEKAYHETMTTYELSSAVFEPSNMLMTCNPSKNDHMYMACCLMFRGDVVPKDVNAAVGTLKRKKTIKWVDWIKTGFKIGISHSPPTVVPGGDLAKTMRSCLMIANSTCIHEVIGRMNHGFQLMLKKGAFRHWYLGSGMEQGEFEEAYEELLVLEKDYHEISIPAADAGDLEDARNEEML